MSAGNRSAGPGKRALVALAMGAIVAPFTLTGIASADVRPITENACPQDQVTGPEVPFEDIAGLSAEARLAINCIADYNVTQGVDEDSFEPGNAVNRAQMASFIARLVSLAGDEPLDDAPAGFRDIGTLSQDVQDNINILANLGITTGVTATEYRPAAPITRAQMASFLVRTQEVLGVPFDDALDDYFDDDNGLEPHEANINIIAENGLAQGVAEGQFAPLRSTTREQMAKFLARYLDLAVEEGLIELPEEYQDTAPAAEVTTPAEEIVAGADITVTLTNVDLEGLTADDITATLGTGADAVEVVVAVGADGELTLTLPEDVEAGEQTVTLSILVEGEEEPIELTLTFEVVAPDTQANDTLEFGPDEAATLELAAAGTTDRRSFLATGLDNELTYRVTLVNASTVTVDDNGFVTFTNDTDLGEEGFASTGVDIADIVAISNPAEPLAADANTAIATPVNGAITVTIEGEARGSVVPVIYVNGAAGNTPEQGGTNPRLELDANGVPTEPFGIAGVTTFANAEAAVGTTVVAQVVQAVDRDANVIDAGGVRYEYDAQGDVFTINNAQATLVQFEAALSVGDNVDVSDYQRDNELRSTFNLDNVDPATPAVAVADTNDTNVVLTVTGVDAGNTVRVYGQVDPTAGNPADDPALTTAATVLATATADADADLADFQVVVTGLTASTGYDLAVTQVEGQEESDLSNTVSVTTTATQVSPTIASAALTDDTPLEGIAETGDVLTFTFNRGVTVDADAGDVDLSFTDADGDTFIVSNVATGGGDFLTAATVAATDVNAGTAGTETVTVTLLEGAEDRNAAGDGALEFPLTLTALTGVGDTASGGNATLEGGDVTIP